MTGGIVITHANFAEGIKEAAQMILGPQESFEAVALLEGEGLDILIEKIRKALSRVNTKDVILFVDLFGATPCNASSVLCAELGCPVATGVSLPLLLEFLTGRETDGMEKLLENMKSTAAECFRIIRSLDILGE